MIRLEFTEASAFQNSFLKKQIQLPIKKKNILIGRGQDLQERESTQNGIINLTNFSNTLSRIHTSIQFSPAWFLIDSQKIPLYLKELKISQTKLPSELVEIIWLFIQPKKECILRDLKSKFGIFKKVDNQEIQSEMVIEFVHQVFMTFHNCQQYEKFEQLIQRIEILQKLNQQITVFGNLNKIKEDCKNSKDQNVKKQFLKLWQFSCKQNFYVLLIQNGLILRIGRSSHCEIQVKDTAISRYQALLKCQNQKWRIIDGNQIQKSKNGTWKKFRKIKLETSQNQMKMIKNQVKIASIRTEIQVVSNFEWLNIVELIKNEENQQESVAQEQTMEDNQQND